MRTVNKVILIGNITRDPMVKTTESGKKVALFTIATNRYFKTADGQSKSESEYHNCVTWGALAERVEKFLVKWKLVYAEGRLVTRVIERENESKLYKTEVVVSNLIFLNKKAEFDSVEADELSEIDDLDVEIDEDKF